MSNPARWTTDPSGRFALRYWDGQAWTNYVSPGDGTTLVDPIPIVPGSSSGNQSNVTQVEASTASTSAQSVAGAGQGRPRLAIKTVEQPKPAVPTDLRDARVLVIPPAGNIGEIHLVGFKLKKQSVLIVDRDPRTNELTAVTTDGELKFIRGPLSTPHSPLQDMTTRPGRLWRHLHDRPPGFGITAMAEVKARFEELISVESDESRAFALEAIPYGLDISTAIKLGVEPWRAEYETLRAGAGSIRQIDALVRSIQGNPSCPDTIRTAVCLNSGTLLTDTLRPWPALAAAVSHQGQSESSRRPELNSKILEEAQRLAETLSEIQVSSATRIRGVLAQSVVVGGDKQKILSALIHPSAPVSVRATPDISLSLVDDVIDKGVPVELIGEWSEGDRDYVMARQSPQSLSDEAVLRLGFDGEGLRRARGGNFEVFGHLITDAERLSVAIDSAVSPEGDVNLEVLRQMTEEPLAKALLEAVESDDWSELPEEVVASPKVARLLLRLTPPDRPPRSEVEQQICARSLLRSAQTALFEWNWEEAIRLGQKALQFATEEAVRDELMNVVAAALWSKGRKKEALVLLRKALEGQYSLPLVCNTAAVAATLDSGTAITELTRLARESPDDMMRLIAAERAFLVWLSTIEEEDQAPPLLLLMSLRSLLVLDVTDDRYRQILRILADHDAAWLAAQSASAFGRRGSSPEARVYQAKARGLDNYIAELSAVHHVQPRPLWVEEEAVRLGKSLVDFLATSLGDDGAAAAVSIAMEVLSSGLPLPPEVHVRMVALLSASVSQVVTDGEPKDEFVDWYHKARHRLSEVDDEARDDLSKMLGQGGNSLGLAYLNYRNQMVNDLIDTFNSMIEQGNQLAQLGQLDQVQFSKAMREMGTFASNCVRVVRRALSVITDNDLKAAATGLLSTAQELESGCREAAR